MLKIDSTVNFPVSVPRIFEIAMTAFAVESVFGTVTCEIFALCNSTKSISSRNFEKCPFHKSCKLTVQERYLKNSEPNL